MLSEKINNALNTQINREFYSAYLYLSMTNFFNEIGLLGFGHWCKKQAEEEISHGMEIFNFLTSIKGKIELMQINMPESGFRTALDTVKEILNHEKSITENIRNITLLAQEENEFTIKNFLEKMLNEQIEEENNANGIYTKLKLFGDSKSALFLMDKELKERK